MLRIFYESARLAYQSLVTNKLRTFLSLLGIMIGIFCIIGVKSAVDSLQDSIVSEFKKLGSDVLYIDKGPWDEDPGSNYWKYVRRPEMSYKEYQFVKSRSDLADEIAFAVFAQGRTIKYGGNSIGNAFVFGSTPEHLKIQNLTIVQGRYFTPYEMETGANRVILGYKIMKELFEEIDPLDKNVILFGQRFQVIGVLEEEGDNLLSFISYDNAIWISYNSFRKYIQIEDNRSLGRTFAIKAKNGVDLEELRGELTGLIRAYRRLKPTEDDNFSINEVTTITNILENLFGVINGVGFLIGGFSLVVGMFSVANIMFVSVKERTNIIGIKKAIGAKRYVILLEFLVEAVILCLMGGFAGLLFVWIGILVISEVSPFQMQLSATNIILGFSVSVVVGVLAGIIPASIASSMDPVEAIRA